MRAGFLEAAVGALISTKSGVQLVWSAALAAPFVAGGQADYLPVVALAGLCGGVTRWIGEGQRFWPQGLSTVLLGLMTAIFLWPIARPLTESVTGALEMGPFEGLMFGGFVSGLTGVTLVGFVIDIMRSRRRRFVEEGDDAQS